MNLVALTIGVALFISGIILGRQSLSPSSTIKQLTDNLTGQVLPSPTITPLAIPTTSDNPVSTATPTIKITPKVTLEPKTTPLGNEITRFIYPNAKVTRETPDEIMLESVDKADQISSWYTEVFKKEQYQSVSHAKTNTNGKIVEKFAGSKNQQQLQVTINKSAEENKVMITVTKRETSDNNEVRLEINEKVEGYL